MGKEIPSTTWGLGLKRVYESKDSQKANETLGEPGVFPFTRGIHPEMYRTRLWTMRQYTGFGSAESTNRRFKFLIKQGQTGLSVAFDLPTQLGYDSDHPKAQGEVGRVGVPVSSVDDMATLFDGINLGEVSTSMTINATAAIMLAMYNVVGRSRGLGAEAIRGTTQNDILKEYIARNTYIFPPGPSLSLAVDIIEFCTREMQSWHPISISGYHIREAGANAVQELAYTFANAKEYVRACVGRGLSVDEFAPRLSFFFACQNDFLEEIAKFRAARRIWARIMKDGFHATNPDSMKLRFHTQTSGETLTAQQPENNIIRVSVQALAAILGGTQSLHTNSMDEALSLPTEDAVKIALRTQQIIAHESGVTKTVDPLGGSYYIEFLTDEIEQRVMEELNKVEAMGGAIRAIESGYVQGKIRESSFAHQLAVESGDKKIVGVNIFKEPGTARIKLHKINEAIVRKQIRRVRSLKKNSSRQAKQSLGQLREAAETGENLMPPIIQAVSHKATTGGIANVLRKVHGEYHAPTKI